jgi:hypothetical protein
VEAAELDYLAKHPGGFDREALETYIPRTLAEWVGNRGLKQPEEVVVRVRLRDRTEFAITGASAALTWIAFFTEDESAYVVPYGEIVAVHITRRSGNPPKNPVGFRIEHIDES